MAMGVASEMLSRSSGKTLPVAHFTLGEEKMKNLLNRLWKEEEGQDLTEYALLMVLIALVAIVSMKTLGQTVSNVFSNAAVNLSSAS
jgi:pilus assembly protein Flp/PilA